MEVILLIAALTIGSIYAYSEYQDQKKKQATEDTEQQSYQGK
jgi:hypothetical protein